MSSIIDKVRTYLYDSANNRKTFTLTKGGTAQMTVNYEYDKLNRLWKVYEGAATAANLKATYAYDDNGNRTGELLANGVTTAYAYNLANLITSQSNTDLTEGFTYYLSGNQKTKTANGESTTYQYDKMNRLSYENATHYTFDDYGNRHTKETADSVTIYTHDKNNRLGKTVETATGATFEGTAKNMITEEETRYYYDNNGNLYSKTIGQLSPASGAAQSISISATTNEFVALYEFNAYNQLTSVDTKGVKTDYAYFADGLRKSKTIGGDTTNFIYDGANIVMENNAKYLRGFGIIKNSDSVFYEYNGQGDVAILKNASGAVVANYTFDAFGNETSSNTYVNNFGYRGEYQDAESGFVYLRGRMYNTEIGSFISEDPIRDGVSWYVYCYANPLRYLDIFGLAPSVMEAAMMADHIYNFNEKSSYEDRQVKYDDGSLTGWRLIDVWTGRESMKMGIYIRDTDDWKNPSEYAIVFRGSITALNGETIDVWKNNAEQLLSAKSADMWDAINYSKDFADSHSQEITFIGHSKGGAEATAAAIATNNNVISFNPASLNFSDYGLDPASFTKSSTAYIVRGEILNHLEGWFSYPLDKAQKLTQQHGGHWYERWQTSLYQRVQNHLMPAVKSALREDGY